MSKIELKPCPFCGGKAVFSIQKIFSLDETDLLSAYIAVRCSECGLRLPGRYRLVVKLTESGDISISNDQQGAADAWNRRASDG
jgi:Lar family restriction alleviation protein